jgi:catechol 2,3-dioxygenase-like lactoylglutathione lyase family enzyme
MPWPIFCACLFALLVGCAPAQTPIAGVDHIPIAVKDLDVAADRYRALGFTLKPGRPHDNSIRNVHAKNADRTELELITATEPRDALATSYLRMIEAGEGPAYLALHGNLDALQAAIEKTGLAFSRRGGMIAMLDPRVDYLFFVADNRSPTDRPEHFVHANTSTALTKVWLADEENPALRKLLTALGARFSFRDELIPQNIRVEVAQLDASEIILFPASMRAIANRPIIGATLRTADLMKALKVVSAARLTPWSVNQDAQGGSLILEPALTHGLKLEFLQGQ